MLRLLIEKLNGHEFNGNKLRVERSERKDSNSGGSRRGPGSNNGNKSEHPEIKIIGVEPDDAACLDLAFKHNKRLSLKEVGLFVDGVAVKQIGKLNFSLIKEWLDDEYEFVDKIVGGVIPKEYIPAVNKGIQEQMQNGVIAGYPLLALRATLYDGSFHDVEIGRAHV